MAKKLIADITSASYYLFIGRSEAWSDDAAPDAPYDNQYSTLFDAYQRMQSLKLIADADVTFASPRNQWISGTTYDEYDDRDTTLESKKYYVISDNNNVYICLRSGGTSSKNPDTTGISTSGVIDFTGDDGYIWKYLFTLTTDSATKFLTSAFVPVTYLSSDPGSSADTALQNQWDVQSNAVAGAIHNVKIVAGGSGYTATPTITVNGNGTGFAGTVTTASGVVTGINITNYGSGYSEADVTITGGNGTGATGRVVLGPIGGYGADPRVDLRSHYVALNSRLVYGDGSGDFIVNNDFRQIGIIKDPYNYGTTTVSTSDTMSATKSLTVATGGSFALDSIVEGTSTGAKGVVDYYDSTNGIIRFHQTDVTGFKSFSTSDFARLDGASGSGQDVTAVNDAEVARYSGDVIFLENRTPVTRAADQIETIKIVLEL
jgi:hypothetical protein